MPHDKTGQEGQGCGDAVAQQVGDHRARKRCDARYGEGVEAVNDPGVHIFAKCHTGGNACGQTVHREDPGHHNRQISCHIAANSAAENETEHQGEQDRLDRDIGELFRLPAHLFQGPGSKAHGLVPGFANSRSCRQGGNVGVDLTRAVCSGILRCRCLLCGGHTAISSVYAVGVAVGAVPVIDRNTSSRLGSCTLIAATSMAWSRRTSRTVAASLACCRDTVSSPAPEGWTASSPKASPIMSRA